MRSKSILIVVVLLTLAFGVGRLSAGTPDSPSAPGATNSFTLEDIYNRLNAGTAGAQSTFTEPAAGPGTGTMHTLNEIMAKAPAADNTNGATMAQVLIGKTYWGLRTDGTWGPRTGSAAAGSNVNGPDGSKTFSIPDGFYSGKTATANDADLAAGNIKQGVNIFGVDGTLAGGACAAGVPKTGQTTSSATGDDGALQKGVAWPNPRFTDNSNGTVTDNLTGLIWLKNANCFGPQTWATALTSANTLASGSCSLTDGSTAGAWRLPNVRELQSLLHYGFYGPAVPNTAGTGQWTEGNPFTGVLSDFYWSSTTDAYDSSDAFYVYLPAGNVYDVVKTNAYDVWPVRGGQ